MSPTDHPSSSSYKASGFSNRIGWGRRPALLIVDLCKAYFHPGSPLDTSSNPASAASPEVVKRLLETSRKAGVPVIWTTVRYDKADMSDAGLFYSKTKVLDVWKTGDTRGLDAYLPGLSPLPETEDIIVKKHPSAFFGTELAGLLHLKNIDTLVICGVSTSGCVRATALDAMCYNFRPMVVGSACGDRSPEIHEANLFDMDAKMADVVGEEEAVEHLKRGWSS